jgi:hypothetical protein
MQWNGSFIGVIKKSQILNIIKFKGDTYWKLTHNENTVYCLSKQSKNVYPCIIDELKPIFNIQKLGTHWCKLGSRIFILTRVLEINKDNINTDIRLNELQWSDPMFNEKIRMIFAFRELLGITVSTGNSIRVRQDERLLGRNADTSSLSDVRYTNITSNLWEYWDPVSFREPNFCFERSVLSKATLKNVYSNEYNKLLKYVHCLVNVRNNKDIKTVLLRLQGNIENVISRVNINDSWINNELLMRFNSFF